MQRTRKPQRTTRREILRGAVGFGAGAFVAGGWGASSVVAARQDASPVTAPEALGYLSLRLRELNSPDLIPEIDEIVISEFVPVVQELPGYRGYLLGDVFENPAQNLAITVLESDMDVAAFNEAAETFVRGVDPQYAPETPLEVEGDLFIAATSVAPSAATPVAGTPVAASATPSVAPAAGGGFVVARLYTGETGSDPVAAVPGFISDLLPEIAVLPGFGGYLWFFTGDGFGTVSLFGDSAAATASTITELGYVRGNVEGQTGASPTIISASIVFADLPILTPSS
ncbi:MAG: hypothetical protein M3121_06560 [Chloroflexota bacterium]|nr:hypothetical protein [Chloroflexota bacterium]